MNRIHRALAWTLVLVALAAAMVLGRHARSLRAALRADEQVALVPRAEVLRRVSLGHHELAADLVLIAAVNEFAVELGGSRRYEAFERRLETAVALDPDLRRAYLLGATAAIYNGRPVTNEAVARSSRWYEAGLARFPADWEMAFGLGCNYLYELRSDDPEQRRAWRRTGAAYIQRAALAGGGPPWLARLGANIMTEEGEAEAALRHLEQVYRTTGDEAVRAEVRALIEARRRR